MRHFDINPENILISEKGIPKLTDFGIAKIALTTFSASASFPTVTLLYVAPEQLDRKTFGEPDECTDIYQLGVVLYELITGRTPFVGTPLEIINQKMRDEFPRLSEIVPTVPQEFDYIISRTINRNKVKDFQQP